MYTAKEMFGVSVQDTLSSRVQIVDFNDASVQDILSKTEEVIQESRLMPNVPDILSIITLHFAEDKSVESVKVTLKLRVKDTIRGNNFKSSIVIPFTSVYKDILVSFVAKWIDEYFVAYKAQCNADELSEVSLSLCDTIKVSFAYSDLPIVEMTNDSIVLGLSAEALAYVPESDIFSSIDYVRNKSREVLGTALQVLTTPYEVLTCKNRILKELGVYTRVGVAKLLKKTYKKNISTAAGSIESENAKRLKTNENAVLVTESPVSRFEYTDKAGSFFGLVKCIKSDAVDENTPVVLEKDGYSYVIVLSPFDKNMQILSDEDTAVLLESQIA